MTKGECAAMLAIASRMYGQPVDADLVEGWSEFMGDVSPEEGTHALREHITESSKFPTVADIRKRVASVRVSALDVGEAWGEVNRALQRVGFYGSPTWSHPAIASAVEALGWKTICHTDNDDVPTLRAQFERYYKAALEGRQRAANAGALSAYSDERRGVMSSASLVAGLLGNGGKS